MKRLLGASLFMVFVAFGANAYAVIYQWTDKDGVTHFTDDVNKVPDGEVKGLKALKETTAKPPFAPNAETPNGGAAPESYGDKSIEWWQKAFDAKNDEIQSIKDTMAKKKGFVDVFERGRRAGQIFESTEIDDYYRFKKELPDDSKKLKAVEEELDMLRRQARDAGVPRGVRGE